MTDEHAKNLNSLQNELKINKQNAEVLHKEIMSAQNATKQPTIVYNERIIPGESVYTTIEKKIATGDSTLPPVALEKTDRTVVAPQPDNEEVTVGVYKINTYRNWEMGVGVGVQDGNVYIPVSLQRNYSKSHSVEVEVHLDKDIVNKKVSGGAIKWNVHF